MIKKIFISIFVLGILSVAGLATYLGYYFTQTYQGPDIIFVVENGDTFGKINQRLFNQGLISETRLFHYYAKYKDSLTKFRAGSYSIPHGSTMKEVLEVLVFGQPILNSVTIPEGKNMYEVAKLLEEAGVTTQREFLEITQSPDFIAQMNIDAISLEGYLYPETYRFAPNSPAKLVAKKMIDLFNNKTKKINFDHPFLNKHQVIILASMVEKETGAKIERPAIAGVFTNRLKKKMRLESDPTTIYGIWNRYQGNIKKSDLLEVTPYNTYKIPALPQGPISNPSLEAIEAVLNPAQHEFLFFVSKNDGTHVFTKNYGDHVMAVDNFQRNSDSRRGKSWRDLKQ
jgi:UPF0755 protein